MARLDPKAIDRPTALAVFVARAEARAMLWRAGELDLHDAVDELQAAAVRDGLVAELGQDRVQDIMVAAFAPVRDGLLKFEEPEKQYCFTNDDPLLEGLKICADTKRHFEEWERRKREAALRTAGSTVEALMLGLRERGVAALAEPETRRRLATLSSAQVREVLARLMAMRPSYPAINDELLFLLGEQL